jgi:hypothetical protein
MDTGVLTTRITQSLANRIGFREMNKFFNSLDIPDCFDTFKQAQEYIDENSKIFKHDDIARLAKIVEDGQIVIRPVINIEIKITGERKKLETVVTNDIPYPIVIGRTELTGYLIDTSKTFK